MRDSICNDCAKRTRCDMAETGRSPLAISTCYGYEKGNPTNADRLRAMTDDELARFVTREDLCELTCNSSIPCDGRCEAKMLDWLKQEAE